MPDVPSGGAAEPELRLVLVTGMSGAGKTEASRALEDAGFYVVDNLPPALIPTFANLCRESARVRRAALVVDVRGQEFFDACHAALLLLDEAGFRYEILFLEAGDAALVTRYKESRRRHPLSPGGRTVDGIAEERRRLAPLRERADRIVDTTGLRAAELRSKLRALYAGAPPPLAVSLLSFGFKFGLPPDADLVLDVRFLPNPHYEPVLRERSGIDPAVAAYVLDSPAGRRFMELTEALLDFLLPHYAAEGKPHLVVAVGCTGGRHRSVAVVEALAGHLRQGAFPVRAVHRDCDADANSSDAPAGDPDVPASTAP